MLTEANNDQAIVGSIYKKYHEHYEGDVQGTCLVIADEIVKAIGGEVVAGYIRYLGGNRSHWWVEKDGIIFDPMTEDKFFPDEYRHLEIHRDKEMFAWLLSKYEHYRI